MFDPFFSFFFFLNSILQSSFLFSFWRPTIQTSMRETFPGNNADNFPLLANTPSPSATQTETWSEESERIWVTVFAGRHGHRNQNMSVHSGVKLCVWRKGQENEVNCSVFFFFSIIAAADDNCKQKGRTQGMQSKRGVLLSETHNASWYYKRVFALFMQLWIFFSVDCRHCH